MRSVWDMIDEVREQPEEVRRRYMYGCVTLTMVFILGIWLLSVSESFRSVAIEAPELKEQASQVLPKPDTSSLTGMFEQGKTLKVDDKGAQAEDFFETELRATSDTGRGEEVPSSR